MPASPAFARRRSSTCSFVSSRIPGSLKTVCSSSSRCSSRCRTTKAHTNRHSAPWTRCCRTRCTSSSLQWVPSGTRRWWATSSRYRRFPVRLSTTSARDEWGDPLRRSSRKGGRTFNSQIPTLNSQRSLLLRSARCSVALPGWELAVGSWELSPLTRSSRRAVRPAPPRRAPPRGTGSASILSTGSPGACARSAQR
jgi:hypothetical protein